MNHIRAFSARLSGAFLLLAFLFLPSLPAFAKGGVPANLGNGLEVIYADYLANRGELSAPNIANLGEPSVRAQAAQDALQSAAQDPSGRVLVTLHLDGRLPMADVLQKLAATGKFQVTDVSTRYRNGVIDGWVSIPDTATVAGVKGVRSALLQILPRTNVGAVTQQGVGRHRVDLVGQDGTGVTVGVMSDSYDTNTTDTKSAAQDVLSGDLPGATNPVGNLQDVIVLQDRTQSPTDEGRGMAQLVHDMAPKARLGFATAGLSQTQFAENIRSLAALPGAPRIAAGFKADIIVDDVIFFVEPMFSDGMVAQAVNDVTAAGVHYFSSAGNQAASIGYTGNFNFVDKTDAPTAGTNINLATVPANLYSGGFHNFRTDGGKDIAQTITRTTGTGSAANRLVFQWDEPFDKVDSIGTQTNTQPGNIATFPGQQDFPIVGTTGDTVLLFIEADVASPFDAVIQVFDPNGNALGTPIDTGTDEFTFVQLTLPGTYTLRVKPFDATSTGAFTVSTFSGASIGITTDYNVLFFDMSGNFVSSVSAYNFGTNEPVETTATIPFVTATNSLQMVISRAAPLTGPGTANRLRYVIFDGSATAILPGKYFSYDTPMTYGHSQAANAFGVAAFSVFRPFITESFTAPGPVLITHDLAGNRLVTPQTRLQPTIAAADGGNTTFFSGDTQNDADTFPNFFGTSAAAPNAAAIAALVLQSKGGPANVSIADLRKILINSTYQNDLDPDEANAVIRTNGGVLTLKIKSNQSVLSAQAVPGASVPQLPMVDKNAITVAYSGSGSIASLKIDISGAATTAGSDALGNVPGMVWDLRAVPTNDGGLFQLGKLVGISAGDITAVGSGTPPAPIIVAGQFNALQLTFAPNSFTGGRSFGFSADRDLYRIPNIGNFIPSGGNSGDFFGASVSFPENTLVAGGATVTGTMADGTTFTGKFVNRIGTGWSRLAGYGFLNAQRAVALAANVTAFTVNPTGTGTGTVTSVPAGIACPPTCTADFTTGAGIVLTATPPGTSVFDGFTGCDSTTSTTCTITTVTLPRTVDAQFTLITAPDSPLIGTATPGNGTASVSFTPPAYNGSSAITSYTVTCMPGTITATGGTSPILVAGLTNGTQYSCTVTATNGTGTSPPSQPALVTPAAPTVVAPRDLNGDGKSDLVFQDATGNIAAWTMNGTALINASGLLPAGSGWSVTHIADFNGDGKADILLRHSDGRVLMWIMNGLAVTAQVPLQPAASGWTVTQAADMNGDGKADLLWEHTDGTIFAWLMDGGTFLGAAQLQPAASGWHITQMADLNGDSKADILWQHNDGTTVGWLMDGLTYLSSAGFTPAGSGWSITQTGDVNGDGKQDLVWRNTSGAMMLWVMNGVGLDSFAALQLAGSPWRIDLVGDLDGDGKADLVWRNTSDGSTYATLMNGTVTVSAGYLMGAASGWTATHLLDLNGDGKRDIIWRYTDGTLATWIMNGLAPIDAAGLIGPSTWQVAPPAP